MKDGLAERKKIRLIYAGIYALAAAIFLKMVYACAAQSVFEQDLLWFVATLARVVKNMPFLQLIAYLFGPYPLWFEMPSLKIYTFCVLNVFGPLPKYFIIISIFFHFLNSLLLYFLGRQLKLGERISFLSSLLYLSLFAHFHAYMWPMAFQHTSVIFFILSGLLLYLKTDELIGKHREYAAYFILTLLCAFAGSFSRLSILILPCMVMAHILLCSKDSAERARKYGIWIPFFSIYLIFPLLTIVMGDARFRALVRPLKAYDISRYVPFNQMYFSLWFLILCLSGLIFIFLFRYILEAQAKKNFQKYVRLISITALSALAIFLLATGGPKRLLIPYNAIVPFVGILASFLHPVQLALLMDPARPLYFIPLGMDTFNVLLGALIVFIFIKRFIKPQAVLLITAVWYVVNLVYLYLWNPIPSRYLIYLSPLFCIVFAVTADYFYTQMTKRTAIKKIYKELFISCIALCLCAPNLFAVKLALLKGRMTNTFLTYDYIRAANLIREDLSKKGRLELYDKHGIRILNAPQIAFPRFDNFSVSDPHSDNMRFIFAQVFNDRQIKLVVNRAPEKGSKDVPVYSLSASTVLDEAGSDISRFSQFLKMGIDGIRLGNNSNAEQYFIRALKKRPYFINYILPGLELKDTTWITGGLDIRSWVDNMKRFYSAQSTREELDRVEYITSMLNYEIDEYIRCLYYMAFTEYLSGDTDDEGYWFSQIRTLDSDYQRVRALLIKDPVVNSNRQALGFIGAFDNNSLYVRPDNYTDRYKFERFFFRLITGSKNSKTRRVLNLWRMQLSKAGNKESL